MLIDFDKFNRFEMPVLTLANPNGAELGQLAMYKDLSAELVFNGVSTLSFEYPATTIGGEATYLYNDLQNRRIIKTERLGCYLITKCDEQVDGRKRYKSVEATSLEISLDFRKINVFDGTYKFYDPVSPEGTLLHELFKTITTWSIGYISSSLLTKWRTFEVSDSTLYSFLMNDIEESYECIFEFDTYTRTVNAYDLSEAIHATDLFVSYSNLMKTQSIEENADELITVMSCYGGEGLNIAQVNPMGTVYIVNFDHFEDWFTPGLYTAYQNWKTRYESASVTYGAKLSTYKAETSNLIVLKSDLVGLNSELAALKELQATKIQGGKTKGTEWTQLLANISAKEAEIAAQELAISTKETELAGYAAEIAAINLSLQFETCGLFTTEQLDELDSYRYEATYQEDSFIQTDSMTEAQILDQAQQLYDHCVNVLDQASQPRYNITVDSSNFLALPEFQPLLSILNHDHIDTDGDMAHSWMQILGCEFNLQVGEADAYISPVLLKIELDFADPTNFSVTFANRYKLSDSSWTFDEIYGNSSRTSNSMSFDYAALTSWEAKSTDLLSWANSSLDMTRQNLINNDNEEFKLDSTGLIARHYDDAIEAYSGEQLWLTHNVLAFSDDGFQTVKTALGKIEYNADGGSAYGLNAEVVIGKLIFGSELTIQSNAVDDTIDFTMGSNGLSVKNSLNKLVINPMDANMFRIQQNVAGEWKDNLYVDANGSLTMSGTITASNGEIAGWTIGENALVYDTNDFIGSNGETSLANGNFHLYPNGSIDITGTLSASKIYASNILYSGSYGNLSAYAIGANSSMIANTALYTAMNAKFGSIYAREAYVDNLVADEIEVVTGKIEDLSAEIIDADYLTADDINAINITTSKLTMKSGCEFGTVGNYATLTASGSYVAIRAEAGSSSYTATLANMCRITNDWAALDFDDFERTSLHSILLNHETRLNALEG